MTEVLMTELETRQNFGLSGIGAAPDSSHRIYFTGSQIHPKPNQQLNL
jgi:hypothetical protein